LRFVYLKVTSIRQVSGTLLSKRGDVNVNSGHLFGIILLAGIVLLLAWAAKGWGKGRNQIDEGALDILKKRYARGEITREEFERMKHEIS